VRSAAADLDRPRQVRGEQHRLSRLYLPVHDLIGGLMPRPRTRRPRRGRQSTAARSTRSTATTCGRAAEEGARSTRGRRGRARWWRGRALRCGATTQRASCGMAPRSTWRARRVVATLCRSRNLIGSGAWGAAPFLSSPRPDAHRRDLVFVSKIRPDFVANLAVSESVPRKRFVYGLRAGYTRYHQDRRLERCSWHPALRPHATSDAPGMTSHARVVRESEAVAAAT